MEELDAAVVRFDNVRVWGPGQSGEHQYLMLALERPAPAAPFKWAICNRDWPVSHYVGLRDACFRGRRVVLGELKPGWASKAAQRYIAAWREHMDAPIAPADLALLGVRLYLVAQAEREHMRSEDGWNLLIKLQGYGDDPAKLPVSSETLALANEVRREVAWDSKAHQSLARIRIVAEQAEQQTPALRAALSRAPTLFDEAEAPC